jgi:hypothetical protein
MVHADLETKRRSAVPPDIERLGPEGDAVRARVGQAAYDLNVQQFCWAA